MDDDNNGVSMVDSSFKTARLSTAKSAILLLFFWGIPIYEYFLIFPADYLPNE